MKPSQVYNYNNYGDKIDTNISLKYNTVTEWVATLIPITLYQRAAMALSEI